ncbi:hypothetical protein IG193_07620 [Infirmifilum lucidum]|uniref:Cyclophilin TM1367-like domain-containing protein n=1 Tax=Infirmifilum lucidum TaxID=2776706 RepID=A0A7L9FFZ4_9CREN|nr:cyclophilin-like family protein [Infirmifilum lucidum]QOJ78617.1 hypothetical protein IG193_07620 [Infirmifilum lucidum]
MYLKVVFGEGFEAPVVVTSNEFYEKIRGLLPITSKLLTWKEEVYFETGVDFMGDAATRVTSGTLAYWPPGKALCIFAWANQPYGPVVHLGWLLGPKHYILGIIEEHAGGEEEVRLEPLDPAAYPEPLRRASELLNGHGFYAAPRSWGGAESVAGAFARHNFRVGFEVFVEDYGFIVESDPIYARDFSPIDEALQYRMKKVVKSRVDVNEEGYVILSEFAAREEALPDAVKQVVHDYLKVVDILSLTG